MKLSDESVNLAKHICKELFHTHSGAKQPVTEIAKMIEEVYGNSVNMRMRLKIKDQAGNLKQLHRAHTVLKHNSSAFYSDQSKRMQATLEGE